MAGLSDCAAPYCIMAAFGCVVSGEQHNIQLHHPLGRTYKQNKVLIGEWYILPLAFRYHDVSSNNPFSVTHWPNRFEIEFGYQKHLFVSMCAEMINQGLDVPVPDEVLRAIQNIPLRSSCNGASSKRTIGESA